MTFTYIDQYALDVLKESIVKLKVTDTGTDIANINNMLQQMFLSSKRRSVDVFVERLCRLKVMSANELPFIRIKKDVGVNDEMIYQGLERIENLEEEYKHKLLRKHDECYVSTLEDRLCLIDAYKRFFNQSSFHAEKRRLFQQLNS